MHRSGKVDILSQNWNPYFCVDGANFLNVLIKSNKVCIDPLGCLKLIIISLSMTLFLPF